MNFNHLSILILCATAQTRTADGFSFDSVTEQHSSNPIGPVPSNKGNHPTANDDLFHGSFSSRNLSKIPREYPCPEAGDIAPCSCQLDVGGRLMLDCSNVTSEQELASVFQANFTTRDVYSFKISNNPNILTIGEIFNGTRFERIDFFNVENLQSVSDNSLADSIDILNYIRIEYSKLTTSSFPFATLYLYQNLRYVYLQFMELTLLPIIASNVVRRIGFEETSLTTLQPGTFDGLPNIWSIDLGNNNLTTLQTNSFIINDNLPLLLYVNDNVLTTLEPGFFVLSPNNVTVYEEVSLYLHGNQLTTIAAGTFPLRDGRMTISVSSNAISTLQPGVFVMPQTTDNLQLEIYLYNNAITLLEETVFGEIFPFLNVFYIYGNPLSCGCDMAWLVLNQTLMGKVDDWATCPDGTTLQDLNATYYETNC